MQKWQTKSKSSEEYVCVCAREQVSERDRVRMSEKGERECESNKQRLIKSKLSNLFKFLSVLWNILMPGALETTQTWLFTIRMQQ